MSVARATHLLPLQETEIPVVKRGLILGGGLAGMKAALALAKLNYEVILVEKEQELGGHLRHLHFTREGIDVQSFLKRMSGAVESHEKIRVIKGYELKRFSGFVGSFKSTLVKTIPQKADVPIELEHGIVIIATGGKVLKPDQYRYGESQRIITQQEFEGMIATGHLPENIRQVAMIQCVGAREEIRPYCSRICCGTAIKNALKLKEISDKNEVTIFFRDMRTYGFGEDDYIEAREKGILFVHYEPEKKPKVEITKENLSITFHDIILGIDSKMSS